MFPTDWWKPFALVGLLLLAVVFIAGFVAGRYL